ncbi:hypothetical protein [Phaeacidiphilus oryzae]|uniref:hypothetical protein n=1 Tax=Phaeacidiphilus oryzae TaxID=348818 RepID=UPI00126A5540|nr:hypothetical protein [Phaeacidiphilus oryzae]
MLLLRVLLRLLWVLLLSRVLGEPPDVPGLVQLRADRGRRLLAPGQADLGAAGRGGGLGGTVTPGPACPGCSGTTCENGVPSPHGTPPTGAPPCGGAGHWPPAAGAYGSWACWPCGVWGAPQ